MVTARAVRDLLDERPDLEPAVETVLEPEDPWAFEDVDVDSGAFGELVSHGVVERDGEEYRVADRAAVRTALDGEAPAPAADERSTSDLDVSLPQIDRFELALLLGALLLVVAFRMFPFPTVYRGEHVVLSANDPYFYRYWVETMLADPGTTLSTIPGGIAKGEPLLVAALWLVTVVLGGTTEVAGHVLAWYPVVSAVITAVLVYVLTKTVTDDRRIALAAVAMLAVIPAHAYRTSLGFADHHAFDYPWLALTVLGIAVIAAEARRTAPGRTITRRPIPTLTWKTIAATLAIGIGTGAQTLAWDASPLLLVPLGLYLATDALRAVHAGDSPLPTSGPVLLGTGIGATIAWAGHSVFGWHSTLVATAPALVLIGGVGVLLVGELAHRFDQPATVLAGVEGGGLVVGAVLLATVRPEYWTRLTTSLSDRLFADRAIAEMQGLFGQSFGWLLLIGLILVLALPYMAWGVRLALDDERWLVPTVYAWYFLVLAAIQVRFVGELSPTVVVFAATGFVHLTEKFDCARSPAPFSDDPVPDVRIPDREPLMAVVILFLFVTSVSIFQVPVKTSQLTVPDGQYETATWMAEHSDDREMEYPENYVFSFWPENRMYNYFVNGESRSYGYAQSNYVQFISSQDAQAWYDRLSGRAGFVVTTPIVVGGNESNLGTRLHRHNGNRTADSPALAHYRLVHATADGEYKTFALVPGAVVEGQAEPNATVTLGTEVDVEGASFTYVRETTAGADGAYSVRVAHPGEYQVAGSNGSDGTTITVPESAVRNGANVTATGSA
ncbi:hypothetical protein HUG10_14360 [Halorarum halophilum]|uniref:dolichyl-phosphooligosaccharide-protein glycotransferase n=1 Tax=Halorarum halophilum TaxID=2743090 RepID=A0A7D5KMT3_9EURY|nr:STT3 domain-containing protein [Halobaculum halophilum]QLG28655.1 hypothetical protein HUG10_14360 [Halobaculum halophilum]